MKETIKKESARKGGIARIQLHGNPGTLEGRRLGGLRSIRTHSANDSRFKTLRLIRMPKVSAELAELFGIVMGDGHVGSYQLLITTNSETDMDHALYSKELLERLFDIPVSLYKRKDSKAVQIVASSKALCLYFVSKGMPQGDKLRGGICPPNWVLKNKKLRYAFLRGLIDTDGSVYKDSHLIKDKKYTSTCIAFTSASAALRDFVYVTCVELGLSPTLSGRDVRIRRRKSVQKYMELVGSHNAKHIRRFEV